MIVKFQFQYRPIIEEIIILERGLIHTLDNWPVY